ncbi:MAG: questin oxidase family protein, partial [Candidatus Omnitrophica bacterium]|nr:questin oxidase family protein [Candidatus Omnitrophota bacterium]
NVDAENWVQHVGELKAASAYCRFFESEVERMGSEETLRTYLPRLMLGVAAHAFHPLLRIGYGIDLGDEKEVAFGLGYWAATYLPSPDIPLDGESIDPSESLKIFSNIPSLRELKPSSQSIAKRIDQLYSHEDFRNALRPIRFGLEHPLEEISSLICDAFVEYHHFAMLHGVTSCHALRNVLPYCTEKRKALNEYWCAVCATYLSVVNLSGDMSRPLPEGELDWQAIRKRSIETEIEHTI